MNKARVLPLLLIPLIILIASCGLIRVSPDHVIEEIRENPGAGAYIDNVPFYAQEEYMCGPSSLASVIGYWDRNIPDEEIAAEVYDEKLKGTLPVDLLLYARSKGFEAVYYKGGIEDLKEKISLNVPLIVFIDLGYDFYPVGHYMVIVGYNDKSKHVIAYSGVNKNEVYSYSELHKLWSKTNFSTLLVRGKR